MMDKNLLIAFALVLLIPSALADASSVLLEITGGDLAASTVFDDDSSIEQVDVFVADSGGTQRYTFVNVIEGQVLDVPFTSSSTVAYNFNDTDGTVIGLGTFLIVQTGSGTIGCDPWCEPEFKPQVIKSFELEPRMAQGNSAFYVDLIVDVNENHPISSIRAIYGLNSWELTNSLQLAFDGSKYVGTLGPFTERVFIHSQAIATDSLDDEYYYYTRTQNFELLLPSDNSCTIGDVITAAPAENALAEEIVASFADPAGYSLLQITKSDSGALTATFVSDDDSSIGRVDIFYQIGSDITQTTFNNVAEGQGLGSVPVSAEYSWFNYYDSDGSMANISVLNQFQEEGPGGGDNPNDQNPHYVGGIDFIATPSANEKSYAISIVVDKGEDEADSMTLYYWIDWGAERQLVLTESGNQYIGSLGTFDGEIEITGLVEASGSLGMQERWFPGYWFNQIVSEQLECLELCLDEVDNDNDGLVDEDCVLVSELFFLNKNIPYYSLSDFPVKGEVTVKNSGVVSTNAFSVNFYFNDNLVSTSRVQSLKDNDSTTLKFEIPYEDEYDGRNTLRAVIDESAEVAELLETNNSYEQEIIIGPNYFDVQINYNDTHFPGDYRQVRVTDGFERNVQGANVLITSATGKEFQLTTDLSGVVEFQLPESGEYDIRITKEEFIPFEGKFTISPLTIKGLKDVLPVGGAQEVSVENLEQRRLEDGTLQVSLPQGVTVNYDLNSSPLVRFEASQQGRYALRVVRNNLVIYESDFLATGIVESILIGPGSLLDLVFGPIVRQPFVFLFLIILAALSAYFAYNKGTMFFKKGAKSTTEKNIENAIRIGIAIVYFILPFQFDRLYGFNAALLAIFLEVVILLIYEYYLKRIASTRKAIKV